jgi:hypothetical protein
MVGRLRAGHYRVQPCDVMLDRAKYGRTRIDPWGEAESERLVENVA